MSFDLRDHTADVAVEATGATLAALFAAVADGFVAASCDAVPTDDRHRTFEVAVEAEGLEALLFDYLDQLIYERDVRGVLPTDHRVQLSLPDDPTDAASDADDPTTDPGGRWHLSGSYRGVPLESIDAREVKAVTYSEMRIEETTSGWSAYVVFDV